jgi:hypothetical protein
MEDGRAITRSITRSRGRLLSLSRTSFQAWVRQAGSTVPYEAVAYGSFTIAAGRDANIARLSPDHSLPGGDGHCLGHGLPCPPVVTAVCCSSASGATAQRPDDRAGLQPGQHLGRGQSRMETTGCTSCRYGCVVPGASPPTRDLPLQVRLASSNVLRQFARRCSAPWVARAGQWLRRHLNTNASGSIDQLLCRLLERNRHQLSNRIPTVPLPNRSPSQNGSHMRN